jgi:hypothetical protein
MHHMIWAEGRPDAARRTQSTLHAHAIVAGMHMRMLFPPWKARRIRHSRCEEGQPDPRVVEAVLEDAGAIPPPGGWPRPRVPIETTPDAPTGDVLVTTHAVI